MGGCVELDGGCLIGLSGAGPEAAGRCSTALVEAGARSLVSWGCAASLAAGLKPGDLILPERIVCLDGKLLDTDVGWRKRLGSKLYGRMPVYSGLLAESDRIVAGQDEKRAILAATGAIALDMESAAAARAAHSLGLPFLAVRSIIDPVDVTIPPSIHNAFDENGALHVQKMLFHAMLRPADFIDVIRLGRHFGAAMKTLRLAAAIVRETHFAVA
jgi:adenosylhomocysteine nucleosidase